MNRVTRRLAMGLCALFLAGSIGASAGLVAQEKKGKGGLTFEVFTDKAGEFRWRLKAANGQTIGQSEGYANKADCLNSIQVIQKGAATATIEELKDEKK
jgi:uncharacterized protein YegP (UPF0339 family)